MLVSLLIVLVFASCLETKVQPADIIGTPFPNFKLYIGDGKQVLETKTIAKNQPIILSFISPECSNCIEEIRQLKTNTKKLATVQILLVTPIQDNKYIQFKKDFNLDSFSNIIAGIDKENFLVSKYGIENVPFTITFNKERMATYSTSGIPNLDDLIQSLEQ